MQSGNGDKCADGYVNNNGICRCNKQAPSNLGLGNTISLCNGTLGVRPALWYDYSN